jgi:hypothetical protein
MSDVETTVQLERAKASRGKIPGELSFEEVIKNRTLPVSQNTRLLTIAIKLTQYHTALLSK